MCLFTEPVQRVMDTQIYARGTGARQLLVYSMKYGAATELAMVLPIPVTPGAGDDAVRFVPLDQCPDFFAHLNDGFPGVAADIGGMLSDDETAVRVRPLVVHDVGAYEASFVPTPADFGRLDERFRLPMGAWLQLRHYADWGFAVFKLKPAELARVHPMAFDFPRRDPASLFFPTLHLHDGTIGRAAIFDHMLYCQAEPALHWHLQQWEDSQRSASTFIRCKQAEPLFDLRYPVWRAKLEGLRENRDSWIGEGQLLPQVA